MSTAEKPPPKPKGQGGKGPDYHRQAIDQGRSVQRDPGPSTNMQGMTKPGDGHGGSGLYKRLGDDC